MPYQPRVSPSVDHLVARNHSVRNFAQRLMESLRNNTINPESGTDPGSIQIRHPDPPLSLMPK